ncbi:MAG: enolase-phosphatase E1 [Bathelium mastoideum]|nr:MAG: enolase-phosphatase E1 [Bathelium mastoideum]
MTRICFPYALKALIAVAEWKWDDPEFVHYRDQFPAEARETPTSFITHVEELTAKDIKISYLKNLQGYLWQTGYKAGSYSTPLFPDVAPKLQEWRDSSVKIAIFSSGSVFAQQLFFEYVKDGKGSTVVDMRSLISAWFDTVNAGPKTIQDSYEKIARELDVESQAVLFISDNTKELDAAKAAGMHVLFAIRGGNAPDDGAEKYRSIESFEQI